jgi:hypothetical protein
MNFTNSILYSRCHKKMTILLTKFISLPGLVRIDVGVDGCDTAAAETGVLAGGIADED